MASPRSRGGSRSKGLVLVLACCAAAPAAHPAASSAAAAAASAGALSAGAAGAGAGARRVILISLDGAGSRELHELYRQGVLDAGGFARFFRDGEVAEALIPVDPTLTSVNHISLATGFPPAATGIVANQFHPAGAPFEERANGFEAPIGTETIWEAARRQGRRVGILAWPGADAKGDRRTADWGLVYNRDADIRPEILTMEPGDWLPPPAAAGAGQAATTGQPAAAPVGAAAPLIAHVTLGGEKGAPSQEIELLAWNADGNRRVWDRIAVTGRPAPPDRTAAAAPLHAGEWSEVVWPRPGGGAASWIKLLSVKPDLSAADLAVGGVFHTMAYPAAFAESLGAAGLHWPGPPDGDALAAGWRGDPAGIDLATWTEQAGHMAVFMGGALRLAASRGDWDLLMGYMPVLDDAGHALLLLDPRQAGFSPRRRDNMALARRRVWQSIDRELQQLLAAIDLTQTAVIVVSDHGMMPVHTAINPSAPLADLGLPAEKTAAGSAPPRPAAYAIPDGGVANVYLDAGAAGAGAAARARLLADIASRYAAWRVAGEAPIEKIFGRQEAAEVGLDHPNSGDLILFARPGYVFRNLPGETTAPSLIYGAHGFLNTHPEMLAAYMAVGAGVTPGRGTAARTMQVTEIAARVAGLLNIAAPGRAVRAPARAGAANRDDRRQALRGARDQGNSSDGGGPK
jgi:predicted AlkP superfamily pyrophosphatase or phosphodiesterase